MSLNLKERQSGDLFAARTGGKTRTFAGRSFAPAMESMFRATFYGIASAACLSGAANNLEIEIFICHRASHAGYQPEVRAMLLRGGGRASSDSSFHEDADRWLRSAREDLEALLADAERVMPLDQVGWAKVSVIAEIDIPDAPLPAFVTVPPLALDIRAFVCKPAGTACLVRHGNTWVDDALPVPSAPRRIRPAPKQHAAPRRRPPASRLAGG